MGVNSRQIAFEIFFKLAAARSPVLPGETAGLIAKNEPNEPICGWPINPGKHPALSLAEARHKASVTTDDPVALQVAKNETRYGTVRDLFEFVIGSMNAEGEETEGNRIYLPEGPPSSSGKSFTQQ